MSPDSSTTITCKYSCDECGLDKVSVSVPARESDAVDVRIWMDKTIRLIAADHNRRSPNCQPRTLKNLMIPMTGSQYIGGPSVQ